MLDLEQALETIDFYAETYLPKPNESMTKSKAIQASRYVTAIDILKEHLEKHWGEAPPSDLVYHFVNDYKKRNKVFKNDPLMPIVYKISKEILFYFM